MPTSRNFICSHVCLSSRKREQLSSGLHLRLSTVAVSLGICLFALFCGGLLLLLAATDRDGNGVSVAATDRNGSRVNVAALNVRAMRIIAYCLLGGGGAGTLFFCLCWVALVRLAHCQIRDQEHQLTRDRYQFPESAGNNGVAMEPAIASGAPWQQKSTQRAQQLAPVIEERLVL